MENKSKKNSRPEFPNKSTAKMTFTIDVTSENYCTSFDVKNYPWVIF